MVTSTTLESDKKTKNFWFTFATPPRSGADAGKDFAVYWDPEVGVAYPDDEEAGTGAGMVALYACLAAAAVAGAAVFAYKARAGRAEKNPKFSQELEM